MSIVGKYYLFDSSATTWADRTSAGVIPTMISEIDGWWASVSGNSSITSQGLNVVKLRDENDGTGNFNGFVYRFEDTSTTLIGSENYPVWMTYGENGSNDFDLKIGTNYIDSTAGGGYGAMSTSTAVPNAYYSKSLDINDAYDTEVLIAYDTEDSKECFVYSMVTSSSKTSNVANGVIARDQNGHWMLGQWESASTIVSCYIAYDNITQQWVGPLGSVDKRAAPTIGDPTNIYNFVPLYIYSSRSVVPTSTSLVQTIWQPSNGALYLPASTVSSFEYIDTGDSSQLITYSGTYLAVKVPYV